MMGVQAHRIDRQLTAGFFTAIALTLYGFTACARAGTPQVVLDINSQYTAMGSNPTWLGKLGNSVYFIAKPIPATASGGYALFKTDGTAAGTTQVAPIDGLGILAYPGSTLFIAAGSKAYFLAYTTAAGQEVWVTDGTTAGTHMVADVYPGTGGSPTLLGLIGTDLIFVEGQSETSWQIFRTDGTAANTRAVSNFSASRYGTLNESLVINNKVYVAIDSATICCQADLWVTDGTSAGTVQIDSDEGYPWHLQPSSLRAFGNLMVLLTDTEDHGTELSTVDTTTNALTILDLNPGAGPGAVYASTIAVMDGYVAFLRDNGNNGQQLWRSDGTRAGTTLVKDTGPGYQSFLLGQGVQVFRVGSHAIFLSQNAQDGPQLWSSDGTAQGTVPLIAAPTTGGINSQIGVVGTHGYFALYDGTVYRVVATDGTVAETHVLNVNAGDVPSGGLAVDQVSGDDSLTFIRTFYSDPNVGLTTSVAAYAPQTNVLTPLQAAVVFAQGPSIADQGRFFFTSTDPVHGQEPWVTDGTVGGTRLLANIAQEIQTNDSNPSWLADLNGTLYFSADDGIHGAELWKSDGTATGTVLAADVVTGSMGSYPTQLTAWNGALYFFAAASYPQTFYKLDGASGAVTPLAPLAAVPAPSAPYANNTPCYYPGAIPLNGRLYFPATDGVTGYELWSTDGTAAGTTEVVDITSGYGSSVPCGLTAFNGKLYFWATPANAFGTQLWSSDGTAAGTVQILPGTQVSAVPLVIYNERLYFSGADANNVGGVYSIDGTTASAQLLIANGNLFPVGVSNGKLVLEDVVYNADFTSGHRDLWVSDGTSSGTVQLQGVQMPVSTPVTTISKLIYFMNTDTDGIHPWVSDGTASGTHLLANLNPGSDSDVRWFADFHGTVYLATNDAANGARIWRTDGTAAGTVAIGSSALPPLLGPVQVSGQTLFYAASDNTVGLELSALTNSAPVAANDSATSADGTSITISVRSNDSDSDGSIDPASVHIVTQPSHGSAAVSAAGNIIYTPVMGYQGTDSLTYTVADTQGATSNVATVALTDTQTATPPPASGGTSHGGGGGLSVLELLGLLGLLGAGGLRRLFGRPVASRSGTLLH
jgi:ELWxxDGT repeat protein